jgi:hypothetical protein
MITRSITIAAALIVGADKVNPRHGHRTPPLSIRQRA